jgi:predicted ATPase
MRIESIRVRNYKVLKDIQIENLPSMCVFLGANGSGKSTLFDVFSFLGDALTNNVKTAINNRGGFKELVSRNQTGDIEIEIKFRDFTDNDPKPPLVTYSLSIGLNNSNTIIVKQEKLQYRRGQHGRPWRFLFFENGTGYAISNESDYHKTGVEEERQQQVLGSPDILALKGLGQFKDYPTVSRFRSLLESWYIANFQIPDAKKSQSIGVSEHLNETGDNLALVTDYLYDNHIDVFNEILSKMSQRVPGVENVSADKTIDGRIVLRFKDGAFQDPFMSRFVSDGTLKMFAYLILLNDPQKRPLICIEEPENYLYPELLTELAEEFRAYASNGRQVFISTHSPDFVNAIELDELFWLTKKEGYSTVFAAQDNAELKTHYEQGDKLGYLWSQSYFNPFATK